MIYIHIPFCRSFCTYCDFYSEIASVCRSAGENREQEVLFERFADSLSEEISSRASEIKGIDTLYIGGGTPSVLPLSVLSHILDSLRKSGHGAPYEEFTMEVNPEDIVEKGHSYVEGLLALGVNRISMGVQSFDDNILKFMNRRHDGSTAIKAYTILEEAGVRNISIDLIFGLPELSDRLWRETLDRALSISPSGHMPAHISSYQLSVEPGSMLAGLVERGQWEEASEESCRRQYDILCETLSAAGYNHYEISNFAVPGYEAIHNSAYWNHVPYAGFGPGAHSYITITPQSVAPTAPQGACGLRSASPGDLIAFPYLASQNTRPGRASDEACFRAWNEADLAKYLENPTGVRYTEKLTEEQIVIEKIMLSLRTAEGIEESYLQLHADPAGLDRAFACGNLIRIPDGSEAGTDAFRVRIPEDQFFVSDSIISLLV